SGGASYNKVVLRLHDGPVDPSTVSSAPPQEIIVQVLEVLRNLGIEYTKESEFKYRCVRPKKKRAGGREASTSGGTAAGPSSSNGPTTKPTIEPIYGEKPDQHDEVRFSVEITRIDRLDDLLSLDIRRLKGNLKSYKFLYDIIRE
ncbi:hypothetical protein M408DRAFT_31393, partial [Serendipita vermifera MAFF 305830]